MIRKNKWAKLVTNNKKQVQGITTIDRLSKKFLDNAGVENILKRYQA
jgi:hypothetical protein